MGMQTPRRHYQTQWAGQYGAAHELSRRGYLVSFTSGNAPAIDLLCRSPESGIEFSVQVKTLSSKTSFIFPKSVRNSRDNLYFILVFLPARPSERPEYYILNREQLLQALDAQDRANKAAGEKRGRPLAEFAPGINYSVLRRLAETSAYADAWQTLPQ